jgi:hypothetical protein
MNQNHRAPDPAQPELMPESLAGAMGQLLADHAQDIAEHEQDAAVKHYDIRARLAFVEDARRQYLGAIDTPNQALAADYLRRSLARALEAL